MEILSILVDEIPENCGQCCLMDYVGGSFPVCFGISDHDKRDLVGNPYGMTYRRSDCPLYEKRITDGVGTTI